MEGPWLPKTQPDGLGRMITPHTISERVAEAITNGVLSSSDASKSLHGCLRREWPRARYQHWGQATKPPWMIRHLLVHAGIS